MLEEPNGSLNVCEGNGQIVFGVTTPFSDSDSTSQTRSSATKKDIVNCWKGTSIHAVPQSHALHWLGMYKCWTWLPNSILALLARPTILKMDTNVIMVDLILALVLHNPLFSYRLKICLCLAWKYSMISLQLLCGNCQWFTILRRNCSLILELSKKKNALVLSCQAPLDRSNISLKLPLIVPNFIGFSLIS